MKKEDFEFCGELLSALNQACLNSRDQVTGCGTQSIRDMCLRRDILEDLSRVFAEVAERFHVVTRGKTYCCPAFHRMVIEKTFSGNDNCRDGSTWINCGKPRMIRVDFCPFCGKEVK